MGHGWTPELSVPAGGLWEAQNAEQAPNSNATPAIHRRTLWGGLTFNNMLPTVTYLDIHPPANAQCIGQLGLP